MRKPCRAAIVGATGIAGPTESVCALPGATATTDRVKAAFRMGAAVGAVLVAEWPMAKGHIR